MANAQPEPSMEEILASIRRIISEDGEEQATPPAPSAEKPARSPIEPARAAPAQPTAPAKPELLLERPSARVEKKEAPSMQTKAAEAMQSEDDIIAEKTAHAATQAFHSLSQSMRVSTGEGRTLEDIVTELLRPLVKDWLDANLPAIVEEKVEDEIQRVARRRR